MPGLLLTVALSLAGPAERAIHEVWARAERHERVAAICAAPSPPAERSAALARLGPDVVPVIVERLADRDTADDAVLLGALRILGPAPTAARLRDRLQADPPVTAGWRAAALRALGEVAGIQELGLVLELAACGEGGGTTQVGSSLEDACAAMLARSPEVVAWLSRRLDDSDDATAVHLVRALGRVPSLEGFDALSELLEGRPELEAAILVELGRAGAAAPDVVSEGAREQVRSYLDGGGDLLLKQACLTAARLGDFDVSERLVQLLDHESESVRGAALQGLRDLTGLALSPDRERWNGWLTAERRWYARHGADLPRTLSAGMPPAKIHATLGEVATHRYRRHELARAIVPLLEDGRPAVRRSACATLRQLDSSVAVEPLRHLLMDVDPGVASAALEALRSITRLNHPADPEAWRAAVRGSPVVAAR